MDIQKLCDAMGIARQYYDVRNTLTDINPASRVKALQAMGFDVNDEKKMQEELDRRYLAPYKELLDKVLVLRDNDKKFIYIRVPDIFSENATIEHTFTFEDGSKRVFTAPLYEVEIASYETIGEIVYDTRRFIVDFPLPYGYHSYSCEIHDGNKVLKSITMTLIVTPLTCYMPKSMADGKKFWGVSVQLYALRSRTNWGMGDFADLKLLVKEIAKCGGAFVGLNPLHAGYPANPDPDMISPYSPSSRQWLNIIYIAVDKVPEYLKSKKAKLLVNSEKFSQKIKSLRQREYVDYKSVLDLKLEVLELVFDESDIKDKKTARSLSFLDFIESNKPSLLNMATYDAMQDYYYKNGTNAWSWELFDKEYQNASSQAVEKWRQEHLDKVLFYCYLQFIAKEQLQEAYLEAQKAGMEVGLYRDLAVGVSKGSCDVWSDDNQIYKEASVGAPPDPLGPLGQSWGLSPMDPSTLKQCAYKPLIDLYRSNMQSCGALRIDHAAGLYRQWWVPLGNVPTDGAYVNYPVHDLLGIIALESHRHKCVVIAEDLGTIPQELRNMLSQTKALSYKLFFGEVAADGGYIAPYDYAKNAMSALTTHDMPTLVGWWGKKDLELGGALGLYTKEQVKEIGDGREYAKQRILDSMHGLHSVNDSDVPRNAKDIPQMTWSLCKGLQVHMCRGSCLLYSSQLEDWIGVENPVNVPGTFREYPNWRRKLTEDLEDIFAKPFVLELTKAMSEARAD